MAVKCEKGDIVVYRGIKDYKGIVHEVFDNLGEIYIQWTSVPHPSWHITDIPGYCDFKFFKSEAAYLAYRLKNG